MSLTDFIRPSRAVERTVLNLVEERVLTDADPSLLARVAAARNVTIVADPSIGEREIRRVGGVWFCNERTATNLNALLSHR